MLDVDGNEHVDNKEFLKVCVCVRLQITASLFERPFHDPARTVFNVFYNRKMLTSLMLRAPLMLLR